MTFSVKMSLWKPWVQTAVTEQEHAYPTCSWGTYPGHDPSEALAADAMVPAYKTTAGIALGHKLSRQYATVAEAKRLGIWYIIFRSEIWSMTRPEKGWIPYYPTAAAIKASADSAYHRNHVHFSWYDKALAVPKPVYLPAMSITGPVWAVRENTDGTFDAKKRVPPFDVVTGQTEKDGMFITESKFQYPTAMLTPKEEA